MADRDVTRALGILAKGTRTETSSGMGVVLLDDDVAELRELLEEIDARTGRREKAFRGAKGTPKKGRP